MRLMSGKMLELLKSQKMIGANKFNYDLKLEGISMYSPPDGAKSNTVDDGLITTTFDFVTQSNGNTVAVYVRGLEVRVCNVLTEESLFSTPNILDEGVLLTTVQRTINRTNAKLLKLADDSIIIIVTDPGHFVNNIPFSVKVYRSEFGTIDGFVEWSTIWSGALTRADSSSYGKSCVAKPTQLNNGRIVAGFHRFITESGYDMSRICIWVSDDNGVTWAEKYLTGASLTDSGQSTLSRNIVSIQNGLNDKLFTLVYSSYAGANQILLESTDGGNTWARDTNFLKAGADPYLEDFAMGFDGMLYRIEYLWSATQGYAKLYMADVDNNVVDKAFLEDYGNWDLITDQVNNQASNENGHLILGVSGYIHYTFSTGGTGNLSCRDFCIVRGKYLAYVNAANIRVSKGKGSASVMTITADNKSGWLNPKNPGSPLYNVLKTNHVMKLRTGYSDDLVPTFTGMVDSFEMSSFPRMIDIVVRDNLKKALDQTITYPDGKHTFYYENWAIENIFRDMCYYAGITCGTVEETGMVITVTFSWETYADVFQFISDLASFDFGVDEYGNAYFTRDYQPEEWELAYTFEAGVDIKQIGLKISDENLYSKVVVFGKDGNGDIISHEANFVGADDYGVLDQKILKIDVSESAVQAQLQQIAERALYLMRTRAIEVNFEAPAIPWLQVGDFIQVFEETTMSAGVYRIVGMDLNMSPKDFMMKLKCFYYADSISPYDLPTGVAVQTPAANTNVIPNMTSDTSPSGICRASSCYVSYE